MLKTLLPVDGSEASLRAVHYVAKLYGSCHNGRIVLLNVQPPSDSWELKSHLRPAEIEAMQVARGGDALESARKLLDDAGAPYEAEVRLGEVAETIVACASDTGCEQIVMGNKGESFIAEAVSGSVAHDVLRLTNIPVTYVK